MSWRPLHLLIVSLIFGVARGQNVTFDITPSLDAVNAGPGIVLNSGPPTVVVAAPGTLIPYEVTVTVATDPTFPTTAGLAGFNLNLFTDTGMAQTGPITFTPDTALAFVTGQTPGLVRGDNVIGISAQQSLSRPGNVITGFALNRREVLLNGQIVTPGREGDFNVAVAGNATVFNANGLAAQAGTVRTGGGFAIRTRVAGGAAPTTSTGTGTAGNTGTTTGGTGGTVTFIPGATIIGPNNQPGGEVVAGSEPAFPVAQEITPGFCGLGATSTLVLSVCTLAWMRIRG
jgi:hypothetical protein